MTAPFPAKLEDYRAGAPAWIFGLGRYAVVLGHDPADGTVLLRSNGWPDSWAHHQGLLLLDRPAPGALPWLRPPRQVFVG